MVRRDSVGWRVVLLALLASSAALGDDGLCRVTINVTDNYGRRTQADRIRLDTRGVTRDVQQDEPLRLKCGHFTLDVVVRGFAPAILPIVIDQTEEVVTTAMRLGAVDAAVPKCAITGRVTGRIAVPRMRLLQLFGRYLVDVPVTASGTFQFAGIECGTYLLVAMGKEQCLGTEVVTATVSATPVTLKVADAIPGSCSSVEP